MVMTYETKCYLVRRMIFIVGSNRNVSNERNLIKKGPIVSVKLALSNFYPYSKTQSNN